MINVQTNFKDGQKIQYKLTATGEKNICCASENKIRMMHGRIYYIPVDFSGNSDDYIIKILSKFSEVIDVRFVKDNIACVIPLCHNIELDNNEDFCQLISVENNA